jgi:hypothetical protein
VLGLVQTGLHHLFTKSPRGQELLFTTISSWKTGSPASLHSPRVRCCWSWCFQKNFTWTETFSAMFFDDTAKSSSSGSFYVKKIRSLFFCCMSGSGHQQNLLILPGNQEDIPSSFSLPVIFIVHVTRGGHAHLYANLTTFSLTLNGRRWHERSQERVTQNGWMTAARHNEIRKWLRQCIKIVESL